MKQTLCHHSFKWLSVKLLIALFALLNSGGLYAQGRVEGTVVDSNQEPLYGVTILVVGKPGVGVITDFDGKFAINLDEGDQVLEFSFLGMESQRINLQGRSQIRVVMQESLQIFDEIVVVGYGQQKRASVVGAITQTTGEKLERAGGVSSVGAALTGNLPGVVTSSSTGMPGNEDPRIQIRASSTWNNSEPLVLVDGVERSMNSVDINSIESISVLKDASATAVFGVQGANGVILITTKRGSEGRAVVSAGVNATMKTASKLPNKMDAYDALLLRNDVIEYELASHEDSWSSYTPYDIINKYRNPANDEERDRYPNVDWQDALFEDYAMSYNAFLNVSGGTKAVKYFANVDYLTEGDLFKEFDNARGYDTGFSYDRMNMRSNLDFQLTPTTVLKANVAGSHAKRQGPWSSLDNSYTIWSNAYIGAPDLFLPQYSNGMYGFYGPNVQLMGNSARDLATAGFQQQTTTTLATDFILEQDLGMFIEGLSFRGSVAIDNRFREGDRGVDDRYNDPNQMWIDPVNGEPNYRFDRTTEHGFDYPERVRWSTQGGSMQNWETFRRADYQTQLNYVTNINDKHDITAMGTFERKQEARGSEVLRKRENWVFRGTYMLNNKYSIEYNGAYNGTEKFSSDFRFAFFSSGGIGWMLSEENFMQGLTFLDMLRLRASYGKIGDDSYGGGRFLYNDQWIREGRSSFHEAVWDSGWGDKYDGAGGIGGQWYVRSQLGNPNMQWEVVTKTNFGVEFGFFNGFLRGSFEYFIDERTDIITSGNDRAIPPYFGATPPTANVGEVKATGHELEVRLNQPFVNGMRLWADFSMTHAENEIVFADEPLLLPEYMQNTGKMVNQTRSYLGAGFYNNWDELYATTPHQSNDDQKLPGNYYIMDFNADGVIDSYDRVPYSYPTIPQNTYTSTLGFEWKGFSTFVQFYGVNNVTRPVEYQTFRNKVNSVFDEGTLWSKDVTDPDVEVPRWNRTPDGAAIGHRNQYDGSYVRLKNAEISYSFGPNSRLIANSGLSQLRIYLNGNNLWLWTDMPDDRESNFATEQPGHGAYPTVKRFNLGVNVTF